MSVPLPPTAAVDPFDLPDWLGGHEVTWAADRGIRTGHHVCGLLVGTGGEIACDLLAVDQAYPAPVVLEDWRRQAHLAWTHGQVLLLEYDGRLSLAVPGSSFPADLILEALARLARSVGTNPERFVAALRL